MIFLSDPHFGDGGPGDDFGPPGGEQECALLNYIQRWRAEGQLVILAGDIFELWQFRYDDILRAHGEVILKLFAITDRYFVGNHDWERLNVLTYGVRGEVCGSVEGVWVEHGHLFDERVAKRPHLCRAGSWIIGRLEYVLPDADVWAERFAAWVGRTGRRAANERYVAKIAERAREHGCERAVFGHTHERGYYTSARDVRVRNCGTWTGGRRDCVEIETEVTSDH